MVIYPARMIESDVVLVPTNERRVITTNVMYEDSDHLKLPDPSIHQRRYPRRGDAVDEW